MMEGKAGKGQTDSFHKKNLSIDCNQKIDRLKPKT